MSPPEESKEDAPLQTSEAKKDDNTSDEVAAGPPGDPDDWDVDDATSEEGDADDRDADQRDDEGRAAWLYRRVAKRLRDPRELGDDAKLIAGTILEGSDRAKDQAVKLIAREVRHYLDELKWKDDLTELLTSNTLKIEAEFTLVPNKHRPPEPEADPEAEVDSDGDTEE